jgi:maleylpyruvate isomerase
VARHAREGLAAVRRATDALRDIVGTMDDSAVHGPSGLPGWTRGHVISHLARNADGLLNLLIWARTGVEHPMYASAADRDAAIAEGAPRMLQVQQEDLGAASDRFFGAAEKLPDSAWSASLGQHRSGRDLTAQEVPWLRLVEVLVHLVDLDRGVDFEQAAALAGEQIGTVFDYVLRGYSGRPEVPATRLEVTLPSGEARSWTFGADGSGDAVRALSGSAGIALAWLTRRSAGENLVGEVPALPAWM